MSAKKPKERGRLILSAKSDNSDCGTCRTPKGHVRADEIWKRMKAAAERGEDYVVRIDE